MGFKCAASSVSWEGICQNLQANRKKAAVLKLREEQKSKAAAQKEGMLALLPIIDEDPEKELAPVLENSIAWGGFMATSANLRYQLVNGFEERVLVRMLAPRQYFCSSSA